MKALVSSEEYCSGVFNNLRSLEAAAASALLSFDDGANTWHCLASFTGSNLPHCFDYSFILTDFFFIIPIETRMTQSLPAIIAFSGNSTMDHQAVKIGLYKSAV